MSSKDVSCFGGTNGEININVLGGVSEYKYKWSKQGDTGFSINTKNVSNLSKGIYSVEVTDANNCKVTLVNIEIKQPLKKLTIDSFTSENLKGFETNDGKASIEVSGGTPNYKYEWREKGKTAKIGSSKSINSLKAGEYELTIKDSNNCTLIKTFEITQPSKLEVSNITQVNDILCFGDSNVSLIATAKGGTIPYAYKWYKKGSTTVLSTKLTLDNISAGIYVLKVTDDNLIKTEKEFKVNQPLKLELSKVDVKNVLCYEGATGSISVLAKGGTFPYTYSWKHGTTGPSINSLTGGDYTVTIRDKNLCEVSKLIKVTTPATGLSISTEEENHVTGFGLSNGSIKVKASGGTPGYSYEWKDSTGKVLGSRTNELLNISSGTYTLVVSDAGNCIATTTHKIEEPLLLEAKIEEVSILCNGGTGQLRSKVTGGVSPYVYNWTDATGKEISTSTFIEEVSGVYNLEVTDENNNKAIVSSINLVEPVVLEFGNINVVDVLCYQGATGSISVLAKGGTFPYTYSWKHGATGPSINSLTGGDYTVTIRDKNLCEISKLIKVTTPATGLSIGTEEENHVTGFGLSNGSIKVKASGGTPGYSYEWKDSTGKVLGSTTNELLNISGGTYTLVVSDAGNCIATATYKIEEPLLLEAKIEEVSILCNGGTGQLRSKVTGGVSPYVYNWTDATGKEISTSTFIEEVSGVYNLEVIDENNNKAIVSSINLEEPLNLEFSKIEVVDVNCYGGATGSILVEVNGGTSPYTYVWKHSIENKNSVNGLKQGVYSVTITDKNGCSITNDAIRVNEPELYEISETSLFRPTSDLVNDGKINIKIVGGVSPYNYLWKNEKDEILKDVNSNFKNDEITSLGEGTYTIRVTDSKGCIVEETYNLANPGELLVSVEQLQEITCYNGNNAILDVITIGGAGGNKYTWYDASDDSIVGNKKQLTNIVAGKYYVIVDNAAGIKEKSPLYEVKEPLKIELDFSSENASCNKADNGSFKFNVKGGNNVYKYRYAFEGMGYSNWINVVSNVVEVKNLKPGSHKVQLIDGNNCFALNLKGEDEFTIKITEPLQLKITQLSSEEPTGYGLSNGHIEASIIGGTPPYSYTWFNSPGILTPSSLRIENLNKGTYTLKVEDSKGCSTEKTFELSEPEKLEVLIKRNSIISCNGSSNGEIQAIVSGGVKAYSYKWYREGNTSTIGTKAVLSNLPQGAYYVVITDTNNNTVRSSRYELTEPPILTLELTSDYVSCGTGTDWEVKSTVLGGTAPYTYLWNTGVNSSDLTNVKPGSYKLTVVDVNGCKITKELELVAPLKLEIAQVSSTTPTGYGLSNGHIEASVKGGTAPYNYSWIASNGILMPSDLRLENLAKGSYTLKVEDSKGCSTEKTFELAEPEKLEVSIKRNSIVSCNGASNGALQAIVNGGVKGYSYKWYKKGSTIFHGTKPNLSNLSGGTYYVVITDANNNSVTSSMYELREPSILELELTSDYLNCGTGNDWEVKSTVVGGTAPYSYLWSTGDNTSSLKNVKAGSYKLTVVDVNGCKVSNNITIVLPEPLILDDYSLINPTCYQGNDAEINLEVAGGAEPYSYKWSNGSVSKNINNLEEGIYSVIITDNKGCSISESFKVISPEKIKLDLGSDVTLCKGQSIILDGSIKDGVNYSWTSSNGFTSTDSMVEVNESGTYKVIATDKKGCTVTDEIIVKATNIDISANFIVSTQVFVNESFIAVNVSSPEPEESVWIVPSEGQIIEESSSYVEVLFDKVGEYEITLVTRIGECEEYITKKIYVIENDTDKDEVDTTGSQPMIKDFVVYPNPSSGKFKLDVKLKKENKVNVRIFGMYKNNLISAKKLNGKSEYTIDYDLTLVTGIYVVLIESDKERLVKKIIIK
ncbi:T9SS type A sorting domain-containing protein [Tenacibaculum sp. nBUS_03]|uniref:T9SS type A sorting domain-containing protein n=1 Tax=Tenacibaculum sp. nBUS_03 TaxID=3395320 RepID=UPI003EB74672